MKRIVKLFWSYSIIKIEKWLSKMARKGYLLKDANTLTFVPLLAMLRQKGSSYDYK